MKTYNAYYGHSTVLTVKAFSLEEAKTLVPATIGSSYLWDVEEAKGDEAV